jgi:hypothetical protein
MQLFSKTKNKMGLFSLVRLGVDLTMVSVFLASLKRTGIELNTGVIEVAPLKAGVDGFLNLGDIILQQAVLHAKNYPQFFKTSK